MVIGRKIVNYTACYFLPYFSPKANLAHPNMLGATENLRNF